MAYRGRGRGRGYGGGGGFCFAKQEPFVLFPDIDLPDTKGVIDLGRERNSGRTEEDNLINRSLNLQNFWKASSYYLEETTSKERQDTDVERFSDRAKPKTIRRDSLSQILVLKNFPQELTGGARGQNPSQKRVRWNPDTDSGLDERKWDIFEKREQRKGQNNKDEKEKEGEDEDEDEDEEEEEAEEEISDDDYNQNEDFDDDEDDFNMADDGDDEPLL